MNLCFCFISLFSVSALFHHIIYLVIFLCHVFLYSILYIPIFVCLVYLFYSLVFTLIFSRHVNYLSLSFLFFFSASCLQILLQSTQSRNSETAIINENSIFLISRFSNFFIFLLFSFNI